MAVTRKWKIRRKYIWIWSSSPRTCQNYYRQEKKGRFSALFFIFSSDMASCQFGRILILRYFAILDACSSGENRQTHMGFFNAWVPHVFLVLNDLKLSKVCISAKISNILACLVVLPRDICKFPCSPMVKKQIFWVEISPLKWVGSIWYFEVVGYSWV